MGTMLAPPQAPSIPERFPKIEYKIVHAKLGNKRYELEVADTFLKRNVGLSHRKKINKNQGMIFIFPEMAKYEFCMVDMHFPLDFVWIRENRIVDLLENASPTTKRRTELKESEIQKSDYECNRIIELNAGEIKKNNIKIGEEITFY
jgi:uncharacterized protein